jgi:NTP pyrophosphatase (non-canonical NTP hydrolase)
MDSEQNSTDGHQHQVTLQNWRQYAERIHSTCMDKMEIERGSLTEAVFLGLAQAGESGELANVIKKMWRDEQTEELHKKMRGEIADILIYLDHLLQAFNLTASSVIIEKVQELTERWPEYFKDWSPTERMPNNG